MILRWGAVSVLRRYARPGMEHGERHDVAAHKVAVPHQHRAPRKLGPEGQPEPGEVSSASPV